MRLSIAAAAACLSIVGVAAANQAAAAIKKFTDIPAQELGSALQVLAQERDFQVVYLSDAVDKLRTTGAVGEFTADEALKKLLKGTGLSYRYLDEKTITVLPAHGGFATSSKGNSGVRAEGDGAAAVYGAGESGDSEGGKDKSLWDRFRVAQTVTNSSSSPGTGEGAQRAGEDKNTISEIIVTAQKREERLQDVPVPVSVLNGDALAESGQVLLKDYFTSIPAFSLSPTIVGSTNIALRGITTGGFSNPTVGLMVDEVPYGGSTGSFQGNEVPDIDPGDLDRVEVLRGPQGTLYGAASMGGLIKYVTKDPSTAGFSGRVEASTEGVKHGSQPGFSIRGSTNIPLSDTLAIRVSAFERQDAGYIDNILTGAKGVNETQAYGGRVAALWRPSEDFSFKLSGLVQRTHTDASSESILLPGLGDFAQNYVPDTGGYDRQVQAFSATLNYKVGGVDLTSVTGYNINRTFDSLDYTSVLGAITKDGIPGFINGYGVSGTRFGNQQNLDKLTQELRLSTRMGAFDLLAGAFFTHEMTPGSTTTVDALDENTGRFVALLDYERPLGQASNFHEYAVFTDLTYHFSDRFDVQIGGRESWDKESDTPVLAAGPWVPLLWPTLDTVYITPPSGAKGDAFTYLFTPRYRVSNDLMVYARAASGYRPGIANTVDRIKLGAPVDSTPDKTQNYEVGAKADFLEHKLSIDASLYHIDWRNIQLSLLTQTEGLSYTANGGSAKSEGVELSVTSRPLTGLSVSGWVSYDNAVLKEDLPAASTALGDAGDRLPLSSRFSGNLSVEQDFPVWSGVTGFVGGEVSYVGDRVGQFRGFDVDGVTRLPRQRFPSFAKTDLLLGLKDQSWRAMLYANNLWDKRGILNGGPADLYNPDAYIFIQPRTVGLTVSRQF